MVGLLKLVPLMLRYSLLSFNDHRLLFTGRRSNVVGLKLFYITFTEIILFSKTRLLDGHRIGNKYDRPIKFLFH